MEWPWLIYRLPKPTHNTGQTFVQLQPLDFINRIAAFIPPPRRHRHHYHGVFAPNAPQRALIAAQTQKNFVPPNEASDNIKKVTLSWARLLRIYEVNPLLCTCGKEMKIIAIDTHSSEKWRILSRIGWPTKALDFDPPADLN
ncbi:MAG: transposase [Parachlamydia sp.]|nr:transposase [Parachlamydia sp.]